MNVKDLRAFRKFYKENVRKIKEPSRNEHFIGHSYQNGLEQIFGFFELFHADKRDIDKFITPFLDMAQDWQAIYEFLQNAFDAKSKTFALVFDQDYLIAFNDGEQFSFEGIRSILNIGQSTKESKSNIGKFGVGFKIVHRLIGKSNGKSELKQLNGPMLFSWETNSDLQSFLNFDTTENIIHCEPKFRSEDGGYLCEDDYPWLIKILLTNFPCGVNDEIYDLNYNKISTTFSIEELTKFITFAKEKLFKDHLFDVSKFNSGTITFLKLGKNKNERLQEEHIRNGISYSLSILNNLGKEYTANKLENVFLNDLTNPFQPADISIYEFIIPKNDTAYPDITSDLTDEEKPERVEFYLGVSNNSYDTSIKSNPNFYLYFPISDELHKYNFIIHCNIFHNLSQRTSLDDGVRNKKLLKCLSDNVISKLEFFKEENFNEYTKIYSAILSSEWNSLPNKLWVYEYLIKPLSDYAKKNVPTTSERTSLKENVRIKDTSLGIKTSDFGVSQFDWFYWNEEVLVSEAKNSAKLNLKPASLTDLISSSSDVKIINEWIENNKDSMDQLLLELNKSPLKRYDTVISGGKVIQQTTYLTKKLNELKLFSFQGGNFYSINEIKSSTEKFLITEEFEKIIEVLKKLSFNVYQLDSKNFINIFNFLTGEFGYLNDKNAFLDFLSAKLENSKNVLNLEDIQILISFFNSISAPILGKLLFLKEQQGYRPVKRNENIYQFFITENHKKLKKFINDILKDYLFQLPDELYLLVENKSGLLEEAALYKKIMLLIKDFSPFIDAVTEADSKEVQREYLDKFEYIQILEGTVYNKETFEHKILALARSIDYDMIREKISIRTINSALISLKSISFHNKVVFKKTESDDSEKYELILSKILPNYSQSSELIEKVLNSFIDFNQNNLRQFLGIGRGKPKTEIINELNYNLENAHQLAFLLLYLAEDSKKSIDIAKYKIQTRQGTFRNLQKGKYYVEDSEYIRKENLLDIKYAQIKNLLKLSDDTPQFEVEGITIISEPFFKDGVFICYPLKFELKDDLEAQKQIFLSMYKKYSSQREKPEKISIDETICNEKTDKEIKYTNDNKHLVFGFDPEKSVYPDHYATEDENLPDWIKSDIEKSETKFKIEFLSALGVNVEASEIVQLRKALLGKVEIEEQSIVSLGNLKKGYRSRTMEWLAQNKVVISDDKPQIKYLEKLSDTLQFSYSIPVPIISNISDNYIFTYSVIELKPEQEVWFIDSDLKEELKNYGENILYKIFKTLDGLLIDLDLFPTQQDEKLSLKRIALYFELNKEKLLNECEELNNDYYKFWKQELKDLFKIYKTPFGISTLSYKINFNNIQIGLIELPKKIDIDKEGNIFFSSNENELIQLLEKIIGENGFLQEHLDSLKQKKENEPEEIAKIYDDLFTPPSKDDYETLEEKLSNHFASDDEKNFKKKLIELLNVTNSRWGNGYIFHFTHLENAVKIIKSLKICSRYSLKPEEFQDSASGHQIHRTRKDIHSFARFYFRPHTPTQWHIEGLGRNRYEDNPKCPVMIFFKIKADEVLDNIPDKCYISNGNLSSDWATYSNDYNFLKKFDFYNLYSTYGNPYFKTASQQEFLVKDYLDLSNINFEIICKDEQDKSVLLNLINSDISEKIKIEPTLYHHENRSIIVIAENNDLVITSNHNNGEIELKIKIVSEKIIKNIKGIISSFNYENFIELNAHLFNGYEKLEIDSDGIKNFEIQYIDEKQKDWLIYASRSNNS